MSRPARGDGARRQVGQQVTGDHGPGRDGEGEGQERQAGAQGAEAEHGLQEDRGQEDGADQDAGDAEHHRGAGDQGVELPHVSNTMVEAATRIAMSRLVISMLDANHHTEEWVYSDHGKEMKEVFDLWRKQ